MREVEISKTINITPDIGSYLCVMQLWRLYSEDDDHGEDVNNMVALLASTVDGAIHPIKISLISNSSDIENIGKKIGDVLNNKSSKNDDSMNMIELGQKSSFRSSRNIHKKSDGDVFLARSPKKDKTSLTPMDRKRSENL